MSRSGAIRAGAFLAALAIADAASATQQPLAGAGSRGTLGVAVESPAWKTFALGGGGFVTSIVAYPDGTQIVRADTYNYYKRVVPSQPVWRPLMTAASMAAVDIPNPEVLNATGYAIGACAWPTQSASTLIGTTQTLYDVFNARIYKSTNGGANWTNTGQAVSGADGNNDTQKRNDPYVFCDPASGGRLAYVGVPSAAPLRTLDGGQTWSPVSAIPAPGGNEGDLIAGDPTSPAIGGATQHLYVSNYAGVYESTDGGNTWALTSGGPPGLSSMWVDQFGVLWGQTANAIFSRQGGVWSVSTSPGKSLQALAIDPNAASEAAEHIVGVRGGGTITNSTNGGLTWSGYHWRQQVRATDILWLGTAQQGQGADCPPTCNWPSLWLNLGKAAFDQSSDMCVSGGLGVWCAPAPVTAASNYVDATAGIEQLVSYKVISPPGGAPVVAVGDKGFFTKNGSPDAYPASHYTNAVAIAAGYDVDYASSQPSFLTGVVNSLVGNGDFSGYSTDGGKTWARFATLPNGIGQQGGMIAAADPQNIIDVPGQGQGLYCSTDGGQTWSGVSLPGPPAPHWLAGWYLTRHVLAADRVLPRTMYAYNAGDGLYRTSSGACSGWMKVHDAIDRFDVWNAQLTAAPGQAGNLFFTSGPQSGSQPANETFWRSTDGGARWQAVPMVKEVYAFGFGAPQTATAYPAIYVVGYVGGAFGTWRSVDNARTWVKLATFAKDSLDMPSTISGDMNTFGVVYECFHGSGCAYYH